MTRARSLRSCARGVVYAEFLIAFFPLFMFFLCTAQLALIAQASLAVRHAAVRAARKAVVVLDDDPAEYDGEPRQRLSAESRSAVTDVALTVLELFAGKGESEANTAQSPSAAAQGGARMSAVRSAAYVPLAAIAPSLEHYAAAIRSSGGGEAHSVGGSVGARPWLRVLAGYAAYVRSAAALVFPRFPGSTELRDPAQCFGRHEPVTARVVLLFPCTIPIARTLICKSMLERLGVAEAGKQLGGISDARTLSEVSERIDAARSATGPGSTDVAQLVRELDQAEFPGVALGWALLSGERYLVLRAEDTLPNQGAPYKYASELEGEDAGCEQTGDET